MIAAVVPAAGHSERMGRPKLILNLGGVTVIARVVAALREGGADPVVVVVPPLDAPGAMSLAGEARAAGAVVVIPPERPIDMRASFERGLDRIGLGPIPKTVLLSPADNPGIRAELVARVVERAREVPGSIVVPTLGGRRGHPIALPWGLASEIRKLPMGAGVNALVALRAAEVVELDVADEGALADLDTPEDYRRWQEATSMEGSRAVRAKVRLFAVARQRAGRAEVELELPEPATLADLKHALSQACPELAPLLSNLRFAVNAEYTHDDSAPIPAGAELAAIPPVSGGHTSD